MSNGRYSNDHLLSELRRVAGIVDGVLTRPEFGQHADVAAWTVEERFGGWNNAKQTAGLSTIERGVHKNQKDVLPRERQRDKVEQIKEEVTCYVCGANYPPCVMDFHHRNSDEKYKTIGELTSSYSWSTVKKEMKKCVLLCANCHRMVEHDNIQL